MTPSRALTAIAALVASLVACGAPKENTGGGEAFRPLEVGEHVPLYAARTLSGDSVLVGAGQGLTLVNVWATWCESCREEMADLAEMRRSYEARGLKVVSVSVDEGDGERVRRFVRGEHVEFPVAHDPDGRVKDLYRTVGVPETYLISGDGRLLWRQQGGLHGNPNAARGAIEAALASP
jgi:cytochrome c biogenesis protein CcmG, thiol:disulfide interchange protein DsbE